MRDEFICLFNGDKHRQPCFTPIRVAPGQTELLRVLARIALATGASLDRAAQRVISKIERRRTGDD